jgi:hypothetical protein
MGGVGTHRQNAFGRGGCDLTRMPGRVVAGDHHNVVHADKAEGQEGDHQ